jgi:hypothetical protein
MRRVVVLLLLAQTVSVARAGRMQTGIHERGAGINGTDLVIFAIFDTTDAGHCRDRIVTESTGR